MTIFTMILTVALVIGILTIGMVYLIRLLRRKTNPQVEHEMTVSEFNQLIDEHESAAKAPLVSRIGELESSLRDQEQEVQALKEQGENTSLG